MTHHAPWEIEGKDPGARANRPLCIAIDTEAALFYGTRLVEAMAGAIITEDWVTNTVLIYAFDCEKSQYPWGNRGNGLKIHLKPGRVLLNTNSLEDTWPPTWLRFGERSSSTTTNGKTW